MNHPEQQTQGWDTDRQFAEGRVKRVTPLPGMGWVVTIESPPWLGKSAKAHMLVPDALCQQAPEEGETARIYGPDQNRVRGMVIEGRAYAYITAAEAAEADAVSRREREQERQKTLDAEREVRAARRALLPSVLQKRLDGFEARGGERWRRDVEGFELDVLEVASRVVALNPTHEAFYQFDDLPHEEQVRRVGAAAAALDDGAFQHAVGFAGFMVGGVGSLLFFMHSAACVAGLGCELAACPAAHPLAFESDDYTLAVADLASMLTERKRQGDERSKDAAGAIEELEAAVRSVRPHNGGDTGMSPPSSTPLDALIMALGRAAG